jgi:hypothetical protein
MIPTILFLLLRKYHPSAAVKVQLFFTQSARVLLFIVLFTALSHIGSAQERKLEYVIKRKGSEVGYLSLIQKSTQNRISLKLVSEVRTRMIFLFTASGEEEAIYENGMLTSSSLFRKMNGKEKANKRLNWNGRQYVMTKGDESESFNLAPIRHNMLMLYLIEPQSYSRVFSDNFQRYVDITCLGLHQYRIKFPDGNYSDYFYRNGICIRIEIHHSLYQAVMELKTA